MKIATELETIPCLFFNKKEQVLQAGELVISICNNPIVEIHFSNGLIYSFKNYSELFNEYCIGKLPIEQIEYNFIQKLIKKLFNL